MNKVVTSKDEILHRSRELIRERGLSAISIRSVAAMFILPHFHCSHSFPYDTKMIPHVARAFLTR